MFYHNAQLLHRLISYFSFTKCMVLLILLLDIKIIPTQNISTLVKTALELIFCLMTFAISIILKHVFKMHENNYIWLY